MLTFLSRFLTEFSQQPLFAQISFIVPLVGLPTVIGIFTNWSTKTRLRKIAEGREAEIAALRAERDELAAESLHEMMRCAAATNESYGDTNFENVFDKAKTDFTQLCENLANENIVAHWEGGGDTPRRDAIYFASIAVSLSPFSLVGRTVLELASGDVDSPQAFVRQRGVAFSGHDSRVIEQVALLLADTIDRFLMNGQYSEGLLHARYGILYVRSHGSLYTPGGYNIVYSLVRALTFMYQGHVLNSGQKNELRGAGDLLMDIVETRFSDPDHLTQFVARFHYATILHMIGDRTRAIKVIEDRQLTERVADCVGAESSACFALRHLYANLLYEDQRPKEAELVISKLKRDLSSAGKLSDAHAKTYSNWRLMAQSPGYRGGKRTTFQNAGILLY